MPRDSSRYYQSPARDALGLTGASEIAKRSLDRAEYRGRSLDRGIRRTNSLLEPSRLDRLERHSPRRSISLFEDDDNDKLPLPKHVMTLGRKYKEPSRRDNFYGYRTDKIQEEPGDDAYMFACKEDIDNSNTDNVAENGSVSESTSTSVCNSNANLIETTASSVSARSCETSPTESSSNVVDYTKSDISKSFESRLLAAENLIKESKLKNLTRFNPNLSCNYIDTDKCDKEALITSTDQSSSASSVASKRRSCIPSLRLRSVSLTREPCASTDRRKSFANTQDTASTGGANQQERSILSKFFRGGSKEGGSKEADPKDGGKAQKPKQRRISRFLRPDFFDTPREESQYVKEKEAQKAAENERRKSRFMRRKSENKDRRDERAEDTKEERICKEQKNEMNALEKDKLDTAAYSENKPAKIEGQGSKSSFLHSLERKLERLRSCDETTGDTRAAAMNGGIPGGRKERECSAPPVECPVDPKPAEVKRTLSVEDLTAGKAGAKSVPSRGRVTSVLGLFRTSSDVKQNAGNGGRSQNAIMSKLKRSPPKCGKPVGEPVSEEDAAGTSRIPTKSVRADGRSAKKVPETKRSPEKVVSENKKSPPKEKPKEKEPVVKERKPLVEKQPRELKKAPERVQADTSADKAKPEKTEPPAKLTDESESAQKVAVDNKHADSIVNGEGRKPPRTKKNIGSLSKNESVTRVDKGEETDRSTKKPARPREAAADKDEANGAKKKKFVRVVKKVVRKTSDSSESKSDEREKSSAKPFAKKKIVTTKREKSPESSSATLETSKSSNVQEASFARPDNAERVAPSTSNTTFKADAAGSHVASHTSDADISSTDLSQTCSALQNTSSLSQNCANHVARNGAASSPAVSTSAAQQSAASSSNVRQTKQQSDQQRPSRANLKLDLTKIPQHTFRHTTPKRDSPKSGSPPKANPAVSAGSPRTTDDAAAGGPDKLVDCLSRMTHHANITGNKIVIDKPLRARDVAELKREVTECAAIIENHVESRGDRAAPHGAEVTNAREPVEDNKVTKIKVDLPREINDADRVAKGPVEDCNSEVFSPEEPESCSFDSWSICSADLNHNRSDLHSPTSPSYSLFLRGDSSESIIDRIRRRSFYTRFNDRKRPSLTAPPPGVSVSATLPRRFSFNSPRERERNSRYYNYGVSRTRSDKTYGLYGDEVSCRKSPIDREKYDTLNTLSFDHHSPEARSYHDHYGNSLPSSSHDSLRKYARSPTLDLTASRARYHSADVIAGNDLAGSYKSRSASASLPRRYGSTVGGLQPKSVEYYEEILSPCNPDYLAPRDACRSPLLDDYLSKCENGYHHNGNLDLPQYSTDKQRSYMDKMTDIELGEGSSRLFDEQKRNRMQRLTSETRDAPSTAADILSNLSVTEN